MTTAAARSRADDDHPRLEESAAWNIVARMLAGMLGFGVPAGFLAHWTGQRWVVGVGLLVGMAVAMTDVWFRYGTNRPGEGPSTDDEPGSADAAPRRPVRHQHSVQRHVREGSQ